MQSQNKNLSSEEHLDILGQLVLFGTEIATPGVIKYCNGLLDYVDKTGDYYVKVEIFRLILEYVKQPGICYEFLLEIQNILKDTCSL